MFPNGTVISPDGATRLRGSAGTGVKEPTFFEAFATGFAVGNPDLEPERSRTLELGVEREFAAGRVQLHATIFQQDLENLIQYTFAPPTPGDPNFQIVGAGSHRDRFRRFAETDVGEEDWSSDHGHVDGGCVRGRRARPGGRPCARRPRRPRSDRRGARTRRAR